MLTRTDLTGGGSVRADHVLISEMVSDGARVLDVGCGDGALLQLLKTRRSVDGRGIEPRIQTAYGRCSRGFMKCPG